ncbi:ATPase, T2SS/T4P/T4SS family [Desulfobacterales bacterium HSG16]|nr:ATPase, T2SS/T4P/T4SS family [Desulfobacterales bacterium HSG16]
MFMNPPFIQSLISEWILTSEEARKLLEQFKGNAFSVLTHLVRERGAKRDLVGKLWGDSIGYAYVNLSKTIIQPELIKEISEAFARENNVIPVYKFGDTVTVATSDPSSIRKTKEIEKVVSQPISTIFSLPEDIEAAIDRYYKGRIFLEEYIQRISRDMLETDFKTISEEMSDSIVNSKKIDDFVKAFFKTAINRNASHIHIEPGPEDVLIRFRIEGRLTQVFTFKKPVADIFRLWLESKTDVYFKNNSHMQPVVINISGRSFSFNISAAKTAHGNRIVLKSYENRKQKAESDLVRLDFSQSVFSGIARLLTHPWGMIIVSGASGSGKNTTLYTILNHLNRSEKNITALETMPLFQSDGINRIMTGAEKDKDEIPDIIAGQDADVIMMGKICDGRTADIAIDAALSGHMVFAGMNANRAFSVFPRLFHMGTDMYPAYEAINGILAQALVPRICRHCRDSYILSQAEANIWFTGCKEDTPINFFRSKGCSKCNNTGFSGRIAIHELLAVNDDARFMIDSRMPGINFLQAARKNGFTSMRYDGLKKVLRGLTTITAIENATGSDYE